MQWSESNLPSSISGKSKELRNIFIKAANAAYVKTNDIDSSIFAGTKAVNLAEKKNTPKKVIAPKVPAHVQAIRDLSAGPFNLSKQASQTNPNIIQQAFLPKNSLQAGVNRSLVSADFDANAQLTLTFDTGEKIVTAESGFKEYLEQHITVAPNTQIISADGTVVINQDNNLFDLSVHPSGFVQTVSSSDGSINVTDNQDGTVDLTVSEASPASNLVKEVRNETGATLLKGTLVYVSGVGGNKCLVSKALATSDQTSAQTLGMVTNDILHNKNGYVTIIGVVSGLDTLDYAEGTQLYLSPTVAGSYTSVKPHAPYHLVYAGIVTRSHQNQGTIEIKVQNGYELDELHDVLISSLANGQVLTYEAATGLWKNKAPSNSSTFFGSINTVANSAYTITHNLNLVNKDAFTINTMLNGSQVQTAISSVNINSITVTTSSDITGLAVTIIGVKA